jgi:hypothetical protein
MTFCDEDFLTKATKELAVLMAPAVAQPWKLRSTAEVVRRLRSAWAEEMGGRTGLRIQGLLDGRWIRRLNEEHVSLYKDKLTGLGVAVPKGTPWLARVEDACRPELGKAVNAEIEAKYVEIFETRRVLRYLRENIKLKISERDLPRERMALTRECVYFWNWPENRRGARGRRGQGLLPLGPSSIDLREVFRLMLLDGGGTVELPVGVTPCVARTVEALAGARSKPQILRALGLRVEQGRLSGRLPAHWDVLLAQVLLAMRVFGTDAPTQWEAVKLAREVGKAYLSAEGLFEDGGLVADGLGTVSPLVGKAKTVAVERLVLDEMARGGYEVGYKPTGLVTVGKVPRGGTVLRSVHWAKLPAEARDYWKGQEELGGSMLVAETMTEVKLLALFDGLASAYLELFFPPLGSVSGPKSILGRFGEFWEHGDYELVSVENLWILRDALLAAQVWAWTQLVGHGHEWLGLSDGYRRALLAALRRLRRYAEYTQTGRWVEGDKEVAMGGADVDKTIAEVVQPGLWVSDRLLEEAHEVAGFRVPKVSPRGREGAPLWFVMARANLLVGGNFVTHQGDPMLDADWAWSADGGGTALPGLTSVVEARVLGNLLNIFSASRHGRALVAAKAAADNGGILPPVLQPLVPQGMGDVVRYAASIEAMGGWSIRDFFLEGVGDGAKAAAVLPEFAALWTWGKLKSQWETVGMHPSLALPLWPLPARLACRVLRLLPQGLHPLSKQPLLDGGGCPDATILGVKQIWAPFFLRGQIGGTGGLERMAPSVRTAFRP